MYSPRFLSPASRLTIQAGKRQKASKVSCRLETTRAMRKLEYPFNSSLEAKKPIELSGNSNSDDVECMIRSKPAFVGRTTVPHIVRS